MQLVTVFTALNPVDADVVFSRLVAAGFHPHIARGLEQTAGFVLASGGVQIQVPEDENDEAREFLDAPDEAPPA